MKRAVLGQLKRRPESAVRVPRRWSARGLLGGLSARQVASRLGALLLLFLAVVMVKSMVVDPILDSLQESRASITEAAARLSRIKSIAATKPRLEELAAKMASDMGQSDAFLRADTEALAGAALQERLRQLTSAQGISLGALQWDADKTATGLGRISVRVQVTTTIGPLYELLGSVETSMPLLFIDDLDIQGSGSGPGDPGQPSQPGPLSVSFECYGFWLGPTGGPAKP
jgi:general secretion pathway protein M